MKYLTIVALLFASNALKSQIVGVYIVDGPGGTNYKSLLAAYNGCKVLGTYTTCEIWDYTLPETINVLPWVADGSEGTTSNPSVHVHLGPGVLTICGGSPDRDTNVCTESFSFAVPQSSSVEGAGRIIPGGTAGTTITPGGKFGGIESVIVTNGGTMCSSPTVTFTGGGGMGATATATVSTGQISAVTVTQPGVGYRSGPPAVSISGCTGIPLPSATAIVQPVVRIGDPGSSAGASFGSRLANATVDCGAVDVWCTGIEFGNAQEQSGIEHVNVVDYSVMGIWAHGSTSNNAHFTDVEVNGCLSSLACGITNSTVPLEIDNTYLRSIDGITVNPVNTTAITSVSASCTGSALMLTGSFPLGVIKQTPDWILISGFASTTNFNGAVQASSVMSTVMGVGD